MDMLISTMSEKKQKETAKCAGPPLNSKEGLLAALNPRDSKEAEKTKRGDKQRLWASLPGAFKSGTRLWGIAIPAEGHGTSSVGALGFTSQFLS